ncbi:MAG: DUF896 domain-containing protein [Oscillospiraceae bacterium]|jgi:uncharacterized protein YnzC (UPF0291/DUF896 family)|nr:DUF896 domain-containing protein [Oscillospiraceae bacterium]
MDRKDIERINELARKQRGEGLTAVEAAEQQALRRQYLDEFRQSMIATLDSVRVEQEDGSYIPLERKETAPDSQPRVMVVEPLDAEANKP